MSFQPPASALEIGGRAAFFFAFGNIGRQLFANGRIHGWFLKFRDDLLIERMRPLGRPNAALGLPALKVGPVRDKRLVKRGRIAVLGVLNAKEMAVSADLFDRVKGNIVWRCRRDRRLLEASMPRPSAGPPSVPVSSGRPRMSDST